LLGHPFFVVNLIHWSRFYLIALFPHGQQWWCHAVHFPHGKVLATLERVLENSTQRLTNVMGIKSLFIFLYFFLCSKFFFIS
jgi:hypothetical protein